MKKVIFFFFINIEREKVGIFSFQFNNNFFLQFIKLFSQWQTLRLITYISFSSNYVSLIARDKHEKLAILRGFSISN